MVADSKDHKIPSVEDITQHLERFPQTMVNPSINPPSSNSAQNLQQSQKLNKDSVQHLKSPYEEEQEYETLTIHRTPVAESLDNVSTIDTTNSNIIFRREQAKNLIKEKTVRRKLTLAPNEIRPADNIQPEILNKLQNLLEIQQQNQMAIIKLQNESHEKKLQQKLVNNNQNTNYNSNNFNPPI